MHGKGLNQQNKMENNAEIQIINRTEKIKTWFKDPYNLAFLGILVFAFVIRLYYFILTQNQPLWWDEADYMAYAKNLAGLSTHWIVTGEHSSLLPFFAAFFFKLGFSTAGVRFFVCFIPSILTILLTYLIGIKLYNKKIALLSTFLIATFWELLFNGMRFHVEGPALLFGFLSIYIFFKGYEKKEKIFGINPKWAIPLTILFVVLTYASRRAYFVFGFFFLFYMLLTKNFKDIIKDKYNWIGLFIGIALFLMIENFVFAMPITQATKTYFHTSNPFTLWPFYVFYSYFENIFNPLLSPLFYLFCFGFLILLINLFLHLGYFKKIEFNESKSDFFVFLMLVITLFYFLFIQKDGVFGEPRWYYAVLLGSIFCICKGTFFITDYIKRYSKVISISVLVLLIGYGGYYELKHADMIINDKVESFSGIKEAGLLIGQISNINDIIISVPRPQPAYYAERKVFNPDELANKSTATSTIQDILSKLNENSNIKYIIVTLSEPNHPEWMRKDAYATNPSTGQTVYAKLEIPFMNTTVDFINNKQDIKKTMAYGNITFNLIGIKQDAFIYEIVRT